MDRLADLDAVTFDANGTLVGLVDPAPKLDKLLRDHGIERSPETIRQRFDYRTPGLYVLPVRVFRAPAAEVVEHPAYAGCKTWVELDPDRGSPPSAPENRIAVEKALQHGKPEWPLMNTDEH